MKLRVTARTFLSDPKTFLIVFSTYCRPVAHITQSTAEQAQPKLLPRKQFIHSTFLDVIVVSQQSVKSVLQCADYAPTTLNMSREYLLHSLAGAGSQLAAHFTTVNHPTIHCFMLWGHSARQGTYPEKAHKDGHAIQ